MLQKKILVPLGASERSLKSVHHALALARRLGARVYILQQAASGDSTDPLTAYLEEALLDLINSARQAGLTLSHHIANRDLKEEIVVMSRQEGIDLLVFEADDETGGRLLFQVKPLVTGQIIQVGEKGGIDSRGGRLPGGTGAIEIERLSGPAGDGRTEARTLKTGRETGQGGDHESSLQNSRH